MIDNQAEKRQYFPGHLDSAFSLSSGGMGIHSHAVAAFATGQELAEWAKASLGQSSSNYLVNPYVFGWVWKEGMAPIFKEYGPYAKSPYSDLHKKLLIATHEEYDRLGRVQLRLALGGEQAISVGDPGASINNEEEFIGLLTKANEQDLIKAGPDTLSQVEIADDKFSLGINLMRAKVETNGNLWVIWDTITFSERFRDATLTAAIHKLGVMLGLTDQLTFDAKALGIPIPPTYRPSDPEGKWPTNWQRLFGEPMPDLDGLYRQAHNVFVRYADQRDLLIAHLFALDALPQLAA